MLILVLFILHMSFKVTKVNKKQIQSLKRIQNRNSKNKNYHHNNQTKCFEHDLDPNLNNDISSTNGSNSSYKEHKQDENYDQLFLQNKEWFNENQLVLVDDETYSFPSTTTSTPKSDTLEQGWEQV